MKKTFKLQIREIRKEDSGCALMAEASDERETGVFFRIQSWDESRQHEEFHQLGLTNGQTVEIEITVPDPTPLGS